jgi:hypothetical protein
MIRSLLRWKARHRGEDGWTLPELAVSMTIFVLIILSVDVSVTVLNNQSNGLTQSNQSIDQLQVIEQLAVRYLHAVRAWYNAPGCTSPSGGSTSAPSSLPFYFTAALPNNPCVAISLSPSSNTLTVTSSAIGSTSGDMTVATNLVSSSKVTSTPVTWTPVDGATPETFTIFSAVVLTMATPRVGAPHARDTTTADPQIVAFNGVYNCQAYWNLNPGSGTEPC